MQPGRLLGRTGCHIHIIRTIWAQTYCVRKIKRRLPENTWYVKKYGVGRGGGADKKKKDVRRKSPLSTYVLLGTTYRCSLQLVFICLLQLILHFQNTNPGPDCSKPMTMLVNVWLKCPTLISEICQYFLLKNCSFCSAKASLIFSTKISVYLVIKL